MLKDLPDTHDIGNLQTALRHVSNWTLAVEAGAHRGIWTRVLCDKFDRVVCFEPTELANQIDSRAEVHNVAVGAVEGECAMKHGTQNTGQTHVIEGAGIPVVAIDSLNLSGVGFLKVDVEGYELFALMGAEQTIKESRPVVLIEENGLCERYGVARGEAGRLLESWGYSLAAVCNKDYIYVC